MTRITVESFPHITLRNNLTSRALPLLFCLRKN